MGAMGHLAYFAHLEISSRQTTDLKTLGWKIQNHCTPSLTKPGGKTT